MKPLNIILTMVTMFVIMAPEKACANALLKLLLKPETLKGTVTVVAGVGAATSLGEFGESFLNHKVDELRIEKLKAEGALPEDTAVYSLKYKMDAGSNALYWADWMSKPDLFAIVSIEGAGEFLVPSVHDEYAGGPMMETILAKESRRGAKVIVWIMDDDSVSDVVWNNILQTKVSVGVGAEVFQALPISISANATIQLLNQQVKLDPADCVAYAEMEVPRFSLNRDWAAKGEFLDVKGRRVGECAFMRQYGGSKSVIESSASNFGRMLFWGACAVFLSIFVIRRLVGGKAS